MEIASDIFSSVDKTDKAAVYAFLIEQTQILLDGETDFLANSANFAALVFHSLPDLNWAGFYLNKNGELVLGAFQGKPACVRIKIGQGVCGAAAAGRETVIVRDVHEFPGHIACDAASNSEIVIPLIKNEKLIGVFDVDSPLLNRFDAEDKRGLEMALEILLERCQVFG